MFKNYLSRFVLPVIAILLGIARNAFRILVLAYLSVRIDPSYINSAIHHKGGTLFFIISLVPFMISIWIIRRIEKSPRQQNRPIRVFSG
jgi:exosortase/archaeosortase family protein